MRRFLAVAVVTAACSSATPTPAPMPAPAPTRAAAAPAPAPSPAPAPAPAPAVNAVGSYTFATEVNGTPVAGTLVITRTNGTWGGKMTSDVFPELPVTAVSIEGQMVKVTTPNGAVLIVMTFAGDDYTGTWELGGQTGAVSGKRIR
ncbi:MAG: hypothetical protein MUF53_10495 [Gemmatimonadaceae bacterium]|nr:hypothetical protein [Gemmatimonadaceae bacterium]